MSHVIAVPRACGQSRVSGGIYAECRVGPGGLPLEHFILDPPVPVDPAALGLTPRGVSLHQDAAGDWHVFDWIGSQFYPNVADYLEETRRFGPSRRLPRTLEFDKLGPNSRLVLLHARGWIDNHADYYRAMLAEEHADLRCPRLVTQAAPPHLLCATPFPSHPSTCCAGLWWDDLEPETGVMAEALRIAGQRGVSHQMPAFAYDARLRPYKVVPRYRVAMIAAFPITNLSVVRARSGEHAKALDAARASGLSVSLDDA